jgi:hypothetical protein
MSTDRDVTRIVRSWLEEGRTALPDRVLDTVLDQLPATPQRRASWPARRLLDMHIPARVAVAAAAVLALAVVGVLAFPKGGGVGTPGPTATPTSTVAPTVAPTAGPVPLPSAGALAPGTYYVDAGDTTPVRVTFTVPAGWATVEGFVYKVSAASPAQSPDLTKASPLMATWIITHVYTDVCHWQGTLTPAGPPDQLTTLLQHQKGRTASTPTNVVLGGVTAKRIDLTVPANLDVAKCDAGSGGTGIIRFWPDPGPNENGGLCCSAVGSTDAVYVLSAAGKTYVVVARRQANSTAGDLAELDGIMSSIKIGP